MTGSSAGYRCPVTRAVVQGMRPRELDNELPMELDFKEVFP